MRVRVRMHLLPPDHLTYSAGRCHCLPLPLSLSSPSHVFVPLALRVLRKSLAPAHPILVSTRVFALVLIP